MHRSFSPSLTRAAFAAVVSLCLLASGCSTVSHMFGGNDAPATSDQADFTYIIGPGDHLNVFVWRNPELTASIEVRPDGKFSSPLVEDLQASGKTPSALAREVEKKLAEYIRDPLVTVTVSSFIGEYNEQIRVVGEAARPQSIPYRRNMTVLDVLIAAGGLTEFAAGNRASIWRANGDGHEKYRVRLEDLMKGGDLEANVAMQPGDVLIIPEAWF